jgi:glyoxalase family protein
MENKILGLHHVTAIAGDAKRNLDFYTKILGLRMVKRTVNFDDPGTYHFYYGDEVGTPGSILTFFPWGNVRQGYTGTGMATSIGYSVPKQSLEFWIQRLKHFNVKHENIEEILGEQHISLHDPDGLKVHLISPNYDDNRKPWTTSEVGATVATKGFHSITLTLKNIEDTALILTEIFEYKFLKQEGNRHRFVTDSIGTANIVDLIEAPNERPAINAGGTIHHVAFRVKNEEVLMDFREKIVRTNLRITEKIDRDYFFSLYFREPGGVLFELATDNPGFTKDETLEELGSSLRLPKQYEESRTELEKILPVLS